MLSKCLLIDLKSLKESYYFRNGEGGYSGEISCRTYSDIPADPPQNVTLEPASSTSIIGNAETSVEDPPEFQGDLDPGQIFSVDLDLDLVK